MSLIYMFLNIKTSPYKVIVTNNWLLILTVYQSTTN